MSADPTPAIEAVVLHPPVAGCFSAVEHFEGQLGHLGDALGVDCSVMGFVEQGWIQPYRTDGQSNEDWFGWNQELLAPFNGTVVAVRENGTTNEPGAMGEPPASAITFEAGDGTRVVYAHVQNTRVDVGQRVTAGEVVAQIGNNGMCRNPHVHVGAWREATPLQIRFDLRAMATVRSDF